nr:lysis protein [Escherichia coli]
MHIRSICPSPREATTALGVDNAAPPDWQTSLNRIISSLRERLITMQKQL